MENNKFNEYVNFLRGALPIGQSFDIGERNSAIGGKEVYFYYVDGFLKSEAMELIYHTLFMIDKHEMNQRKDAKDFIKHHIPYAQATAETDKEKLMKSLLTGLILMVIDGFSEVIIMDLRTYPARSVDEPEKEKSLRGAKDGFIETLLFNTNMIRRRIRDPNLIFEIHTVGTSSRTDVCIGYIKGMVDEKLLKKVQEKIAGIRQDTLTVGDQSLVEALDRPKWANPLPKVRYTQRPDVVAAHLTEGKLVVLIDNSPTAVLIPTCVFDFLQDTDDYYFPVMTGNYLRFIRSINMIAVIFLTPVYLMMAEGDIPMHPRLEFFFPDEGYSMPLFVQFILLEVAIDGLKLASLSTPSALGMSLSVIGALILGQFAVDSGWFIPQTILCMAVMALAGFTQPSIELGYAIKFMRVFILIGAAILGVWGAAAALVISLIILARTRNIVGDSYLYPLFPFHWATLKHLLFRTRKREHTEEEDQSGRMR
ncbi:MAG TPA: spore germination protein [Anaerovoracaceae bacterium]|nr:spore germination protein [Anaerovoracaceae bacterium]